VSDAADREVDRAARERERVHAEDLAQRPHIVHLRVQVEARAPGDPGGLERHRAAAADRDQVRAREQRVDGEQPALDAEQGHERVEPRAADAAAARDRALGVERHAGIEREARIGEQRAAGGERVAAGHGGKQRERDAARRPTLDATVVPRDVRVHRERASRRAQRALEAGAGLAERRRELAAVQRRAAEPRAFEAQRGAAPGG
jgi:hypothetical protein